MSEKTLNGAATPAELAENLREMGGEILEQNKRLRLRLDAYITADANRAERQRELAKERIVGRCIAAAALALAALYAAAHWLTWPVHPHDEASVALSLMCAGYAAGIVFRSGE